MYNAPAPPKRLRPWSAGYAGVVVTSLPCSSWDFVLRVPGAAAWRGAALRNLTTANQSHYSHLRLKVTRI